MHVDVLVQMCFDVRDLTSEDEENSIAKVKCTFKQSFGFLKPTSGRVEMELCVVGEGGDGR